MQPGGHYLQQHQQAQQMTPQSLMAARSSMLYSQQQFSALQQQQALHSQLGMSSGGSSGLHMLQSEANSSGTTGGALGAGGFPDLGVAPLGKACRLLEGESKRSDLLKGEVAGAQEDMVVRGASLFI
ncbi:unnamed protein product [Camellia sinensis]